MLQQSYYYWKYSFWYWPTPLAMWYDLHIVHIFTHNIYFHTCTHTHSYYITHIITFMFVLSSSYEDSTKSFCFHHWSLLDQPHLSCMLNNTNNLKGSKHNNQSFNELMATNKSGCCKHLDVGCNQGLTWHLDPLIPPPYKQIPEIPLDNWWAIYIIIN